MEEIARVRTRQPPSDRLPAVLPAPTTAQPDLLDVPAETLAASAHEVTAAAARLVRAGTPPADVTGFLTSAHDALYVYAARNGEAALGPPPCPYALLVLGSGARRESTLRTDQDHALVLADDPPAGADGWFAALAEYLAVTLA